MNVARYIGFWSAMAVSRWLVRVEGAGDDVPNVAHSIRPFVVAEVRGTEWRLQNAGVACYQ